MAKVIDIFNSLDKNGQQCNTFIQNLLTCNSDLPMSRKEIDTLLSSIISIIQTRLNKAVTRSEGFSILIKILPKCTKDILSEYVPKWIPIVIKVLESRHSTIKDITLACQALSMIIIPCKEIPDLQKKISMDTVKLTISLIANMDLKQRCGATLHVVATMLYYYKEPTERLQGIIRKIILPLIDSDKNNLVNAGAKCNALLARATERSFKPTPNKLNYTCWIHNQALICNSLHLIMDKLFSDIIQLDSVDISDHLELPEISNANVIDYYTGLERRFENLCIYLLTMLRGCAGKNSVNPTDILKVVCRGLAVSPENLQNDDSLKNTLLLLSLSKIHTSLLKVLDGFIGGFCQVLIPYSTTILKLYQQTLKWSKKVGATLSGSRPFTNVKIAVYNSLSFWLTSMGPLSGIEKIAEDILHYIFMDLVPDKDEILLTVQKNHNVSKKVAKKLRNSQYENSTALGNAPTDVKDPLVNAELCQAALTTLQDIFINSGCLLKENIFIATQQLIVPLLYDLYLGNDKQSFYTKNEKCRLNLLKALRALQMNSNPLTPPPTQYSTEIFILALRDSSSEIVEEAKLTLASLEKIVHPNGPTLSFFPATTQTENEGDVNLLEKRRPCETLDRVRDILKDVQNLEAESNVTNGQKRDAGKDEDGDKGEGDNLDGPSCSKKQKLRIVESIVIAKPARTCDKVEELSPDECLVANKTIESLEIPSENPCEDVLSKNLNGNQDNIEAVNLTDDDDSMHSFKSIEEIAEIPEKEKEPLNNVTSSNEEDEMLALFVDEIRTD